MDSLTHASVAFLNTNSTVIIVLKTLAAPSELPLKMVFADSVPLILCLIVITVQVKAWINA